MSICSMLDAHPQGLARLYFNIANEQLHYFYLHNIFAKEMADYEKEVCFGFNPRLT